MHGNRPWLVVTVMLMLPVTTGCGHHKARQSPTAVHTPEPKLILPEWAPENPSPEFLRAARVLKPLPPEAYTQAAEGDLAMRAFAERFQRTFPLSYELFGALTDRQIEEFRSKRVISIPVKSLTSGQRAALDRWFEGWRKTMDGTAPRQMEHMNDYLVHLYKTGAREDLSNVELMFDARVVAGVSLLFEIREPDGTLSNRCGIEFALFD